MGIELYSLLNDAFETFDFGYFGFDSSSLIYLWLCFTAIMLLLFLPFGLVIRAIRRFTE